jgi:ribulose-5-phosphate 4-epimerase/fuculose-1-phosphate aldolase
MKKNTMETYQSVKFHCSQTGPSFSYDKKLEDLNQWVFLFTELGLAPLHKTGTYGNQSYRTGPSSFIITRSEMNPQKQLNVEDYVHVTGFVAKDSTFITEGLTTPSSESFLHNSLYETLPHINAIFHGHSSLLGSNAQQLGIPVTKQYHDYGTPELANSALQMTDQCHDFFILKNHGFVSLGKNIETAGKMTLDYYLKLITLIRGIGSRRSLR